VQKDALSVALISESLSARTECRRLASRMLVSALRSAPPECSQRDVMQYVDERASREVATEARLLARDIGLQEEA
jgi:hypothetical protein